MEYQIGEKVGHLFHGETIFRIIGSKELPYKREMMSDVYPLDGNDWVLTKVELDAGTFNPFVYAKTEHLTKVYN